MTNYFKNINDLSKDQAILIIQSFQSSSPPKPTLEEPTIAEILEIGMAKVFYLVDGNRISGKIIQIKEGRCHIETAEGLLKIPMTDILEETIDVTKLDDARYKGPLITEDEDYMVIRSKYGDVEIPKKEIKKMDRYHGGKLIPWVENKKKFHSGEEELISVFFDNNAFVLEPNTFFLSGMSVGYGFTDRFMITTQFGSNFNGDLNLHPKMRFWHKKTSKQEKALAWGLGLHRAYPTRKLISKYSHAWYVNDDKNQTLNMSICSDDYDEDYNDSSLRCISTESLDNSFISIDDQRRIFVSGYLVYSSRRKNPTGRGKVGWSVGLASNNMTLLKNDSYTCTSNCPIDKNGNTINKINYKDDLEFMLPFRLFSTFEYDLQKKLKFVAAMWIDNSSRSVDFNDVIDDYFDSGDSFSFDFMGGTYNLFDFDFGFQYAINDNFRLGLHFQQPYIDIYWEFFEL